MITPYGYKDIQPADVQLINLKKRVYKTYNSHHNFLSNQISPSWPVGLFEDAPLQNEEMRLNLSEVQYLSYLCGVEKGIGKITDSDVTPVPLNTSLFNTRCQRISLEVNVTWKFHITSCFNISCLYWALTHFVIEKLATVCSVYWDYVGFREFQHFHMSEYVLFL